VGDGRLDLKHPASSDGGIRGYGRKVVIVLPLESLYLSKVQIHQNSSGQTPGFLAPIRERSPIVRTQTGGVASRLSTSRTGCIVKI
jgi:hypothetical protein